jgi:hypothetical protein
MYGEDLKRFYFEAFNKLMRLTLVYSARSLLYARKCDDVRRTCVTVLESLHFSDATQALVNEFIHNTTTWSSKKHRLRQGNDIEAQINTWMCSRNEGLLRNEEKKT